MKRLDVIQAFEAFDGSGQDRLALFFHGGIVDKASGTQHAAEDFTRYKDVCYPYFFVWESGIWEVLAHHLPGIFGDVLFRSVASNARSVLARRLNLAPAGPMPFAVSALAAGAPDPFDEVPLTDEQRKALDVSSTDIDDFVQSIVADESVRQAIAALAQQNAVPVQPQLERIQPEASSIRQSDNHYLNSPTLNAVVSAYWAATPILRDATSAEVLGLPIAPPAVTNAISMFAHIAAGLFVNLGKRFLRKRDHGITCTIVEEILRSLYVNRFGSGIWEEMKKETADAFGPDANTFGGTAVIDELVETIRNRPRLKVTLVGHSTGAVYIGNFLRSVDAALTRQGNATFAFDIVLMAPAHTFTFWLASYLRRRIRALRAFGMTNQTEQNDLLMSSDVATDPDAPILGRVYPHSLLYLISGVLETFAPNIPTTAPHDLDTSDMPIFGMDRFFDTNKIFDAADYPDIEKARRDLGNANGSNLFMRVLSPTLDGAPPGQRCQAQKHGGFPSDQLMIDSLRFCLTNGIT